MLRYLQVSPVSTFFHRTWEIVLVAWFVENPIFSYTKISPMHSTKCKTFKMASVGWSWQRCLVPEVQGPVQGHFHFRLRNAFAHAQNVFSVKKGLLYWIKTNFTINLLPDTFHFAMQNTSQCNDFCTTAFSLGVGRVKGRLSTHGMEAEILRCLKRWGKGVMLKYTYPL